METNIRRRTISTEETPKTRPRKSECRILQILCFRVNLISTIKIHLLMNQLCAAPKAVFCSFFLNLSRKN